ncbi:MAG: multidrug effflux MFS transporter [Rhodocyclaceae bacterium]|nr:multidrug effflux MFS transporter [Rhodocyclaceae bacterium]MCB1962131.1 multidrug effflux MFS transporter [Rhodocyclaceae bacterium]
MPATHRFLAAILAALAAIGPFSIDTYLPAFHDIGAGLAAHAYDVQLTLTFYMGPFAFMVLWHGALADRFGRRNVILVAMAVFALASLGCALAPSIHWLWLGRALQGMSAGAGMVVGRAVVRDVFDGAQAQRVMSQVMMMFAIAPAIAPIIGGWILALASWRAIFVFLALFGLALLVISARQLPETLPPDKRQSLHPAALARAYLAVVRDPVFLCVTAAVAFNFNGFFIYVLSAPTFLVTHLGLSPQAFGWLFIPAMVGMMSGAWLSGRLAGAWRPGRTIAAGFVVMALAAALNLVIHQLGAPGLPASVVPIPLYTFGMALAMPSLSLIALDRFPARRGLAASCQSFMQMALNAFTAAITAPLLWASVAHMSFGMAGYLALGAVAFTLAHRLARRGAVTPQ